MPDFIQNEGIMAKTINMRRNPETQAALDGAARVLSRSPYVRESVRNDEGYVLLDVVTLSLKALALYIPYLDREHPGWDGQNVGEALPRKPHLHIERTNAVQRYIQMATRELMRGTRTRQMIPDSELIRLALIAVALYGEELNRRFPDWQKGEAE